jgi:hypothetical protein
MPQVITRNRPQRNEHGHRYGRKVGRISFDQAKGANSAHSADELNKLESSRRSGDTNGDTNGDLDDALRL